MKMSISIRRAADVLVIDVSGRLVAGGPEFAFATETRRAIDDGHAAVVVNLAGVTALDAAGIGAIIGAIVAARERGVTVTIADAPPRVRRLLSLTGVWAAVCGGAAHPALTPCAAPRM